MTPEALRTVQDWRDRLSLEERALLLEQILAALEAGTLRPNDPVRLVLAADGTYRLMLSQESGDEP